MPSNLCLLSLSKKRLPFDNSVDPDLGGGLLWKQADLEPHCYPSKNSPVVKSGIKQLEFLNIRY